MATAKGEVVRRQYPLSLPEARWVADQIIAQMEKVAAQGHPLGRFLCREGVHEMVRVTSYQGDLDVYELDGEIIGIVLSKDERPWWSSEPILVEQSVICFKEDFKGFGRIAARRLEEKARDLRCPIIHTGGILCPDDPLLRNLYMKKSGFTFFYPSFVKVTN